jgi:hypothetical protein
VQQARALSQKEKFVKAEEPHSQITLCVILIGQKVNGSPHFSLANLPVEQYGVYNVFAACPATEHLENILRLMVSKGSGARKLQSLNLECRLGLIWFGGRHV